MVGQKKCFREIFQLEQHIGVYEYFPWKIHELSGFVELSSSFVAHSDGKSGCIDVPLPPHLVDIGAVSLNLCATSLNQQS